MTAATIPEKSLNPSFSDELSVLKFHVNQQFHCLSQLIKDYHELADMIPVDSPGSRLLPRLNDDLFQLSLQLLEPVGLDSSESNE